MLLAIALGTASAGPAASQVNGNSGLSPEARRKKAIGLYDEASALFQSDKDAAALDKLKEVIELEPTFASAYVNCGAILAKQGKYVEATAAVKKGLDMRADMPLGWLALGQCLAMQSDMPGAVKALKQCISVAPDSLQAAIAKKQLELLELEIKRTSGGAAKVSADAPDYLDEATQQAFLRWPQQATPIRVFIKDATSVPHYRQTMGEILKKSFADWADASRGRITFEFVDDPNKAQVDCMWTDDPKLLVNTAEGGHALLSADGHDIKRVRVVVLTVDLPEKKPVTDDNTRTMCLHEIGHALGLTGHSSNPKDIMFRTPELPTALTERDKQTLKALYVADEARVARGGVVSEAMDIEGDPTSLPVIMTKLHREGVNALKAKNFQTAREKFSEAVRHSPDDRIAKFNLAVALLGDAIEGHGDDLRQTAPLYEAAISQFEQCGSSENVMNSLVFYSKAMAKAGNLDKATELIKRAQEMKEKGL